jgi:hypothetical protein
MDQKSHPEVNYKLINSGGNGMKSSSDHVTRSAVELLELSELNSPYTHQLIKIHRRRLVKRLLSTNKIDQQTADILLN